MTLRCHAVLAVVSHGCPPPRDRYLRVTHPSATDSRSCPCDLHVLSMPPAFALSQDQTLRFIQHPSRSQSTKRTGPGTHQSIRNPHRSRTKPFETNCQRIEEYINSHPKQQPISPGTIPDQSKPLCQPPARKPENSRDAANVSLPIRFTSQRTKPDQRPQPPHPASPEPRQGREI